MIGYRYSHSSVTQGTGTDHYCDKEANSREKATKSEVLENLSENSVTYSLLYMIMRLYVTSVIDVSNLPYELDVPMNFLWLAKPGDTVFDVLESMKEAFDFNQLISTSKKDLIMSLKIEGPKNGMNSLHYNLLNTFLIEDVLSDESQVFLYVTDKSSANGMSSDTLKVSDKSNKEIYTQDDDYKPIVTSDISTKSVTSQSVDTCSDGSSTESDDSSPESSSSDSDSAPEELAIKVEKSKNYLSKCETTNLSNIPSSFISTEAKEAKPQLKLINRTIYGLKIPDDPKKYFYGHPFTLMDLNFSLTEFYDQNSTHGIDNYYYDWEDLHGENLKEYDIYLHKMGTSNSKRKRKNVQSFMDDLSLSSEPLNPILENSERINIDALPDYKKSDIHEDDIICYQVLELNLSTFTPALSSFKFAKILKYYPGEDSIEVLPVSGFYSSSVGMRQEEGWESFAYDKENKFLPRKLLKYVFKDEESPLEPRKVKWNDISKIKLVKPS